MFNDFSPNSAMPLPIQFRAILLRGSCRTALELERVQQDSIRKVRIQKNP